MKCDICCNLAYETQQYLTNQLLPWHNLKVLIHDSKAQEILLKDILLPMSKQCYIVLSTITIC
jgi:hypothetical protein